MAYEMKDNTGNLFKRSPEQMTSENSPPYEGDFKVVCPHCQAESRAWIKGWIRESPKIGKYFSLALKFRTAAPQRQPDRDRVPDQKPAAPAKRPAYGEDDDKIPF
jgi:hypothetical protein